MSPIEHLQYVVTLVKLSDTELDAAIAAAREISDYGYTAKQLEREKERRKAGRTSSTFPLNI